MTAAVGTTIEANGLSREHEGASLMLTFAGVANPAVTTWTIGDVEVPAADLIRGGGSISNYDTGTRVAEVSIPARMEGNDVTFTVARNAVRTRRVVNDLLLRGIVTGAMPTGTHVMLAPGIFVCRTHPTEHFFVLAHRSSGRVNEGGVAQLDFTRGHGQIGIHADFATYPTCNPQAGAEERVLFGHGPAHRAPIAVRCATTQFVGMDRVAAPPR